MAFERLSEKMNKIFKRLKSHGKLTEKDVNEVMHEVKFAFLEADVNYKIVKNFIMKISERAVGKDVLMSLTPAQQVIKIINEELCALMSNRDNEKIKFTSKHPTVIIMCGLQGSGKTTNAAKLANMLKKEGHNPLLAACDIYRPAAINQLQIIGRKANVEIFEMGQINPVVIAKQSLIHAKDYGYDVLIIDTAGRLNIDKTLMNELKEIKKLTIPDEIMLVVDAMTGQDAANIAKSFDEAVGITSILMSKLDSDTRGGAALSVLTVTGKPIKYIGTGEKLDDFERFHPKRMASRILGMGDVLTLIEKIENIIAPKEAKQITKKIKENKFNMNDLLNQMKWIRKIGSIKYIINMIPNIGYDFKNIDIDENKLIHVEAIINSMTRSEREKPSIINFSRKKRIAAGSGTSIEDINRLLKQFEQMRNIMKHFTIKSMKKRLEVK